MAGVVGVVPGNSAEGEELGHRHSSSSVEVAVEDTDSDVCSVLELVLEDL